MYPCMPILYFSHSHFHTFKHPPQPEHQIRKARLVVQSGPKSDLSDGWPFAFCFLPQREPVRAIGDIRCHMKPQAIPQPNDAEDSGMAGTKPCLWKFRKGQSLQDSAAFPMGQLLVAAPSEAVQIRAHQQQIKKKTPPKPTNSPKVTPGKPHPRRQTKPCKGGSTRRRINLARNRTRFSSGLGLRERSIGSELIYGGGGPKDIEVVHDGSRCRWGFSLKSKL
ncbi:uncharacterized protein H6S33_004830 [Morchella sextelata]|uniref:uncharacterized protein n=1 Tax=Morchella sextelata TaxID=1174677 RepID=UPI001D041757|nr:uncharacterized protein H6S33_004830 [Morchella sextelata]KAH0605608.1 hypothetical protein H6S33_004830 [Morchella sextelata]